MANMEKERDKASKKIEEKNMKITALEADREKDAATIQRLQADREEDAATIQNLQDQLKRLEAEVQTQKHPPVLDTSTVVMEPIANKKKRTTKARTDSTHPPVPKSSDIIKNSPAKEQPDPKFVCVCGYRTNLKNRLTSHQAGYCSVIPPTVNKNFACPICGVKNSYDGIRAHLVQFTKEERQNQARNSKHSEKNAAEHQKALDDFKTNYGPKK